MIFGAQTLAQPVNPLIVRLNISRGVNTVTCIIRHGSVRANFLGKLNARKHSSHIGLLLHVTRVNDRIVKGIRCVDHNGTVRHSMLKRGLNLNATESKRKKQLHLTDR